MASAPPGTLQYHSQKGRDQWGQPTAAGAPHPQQPGAPQPAGGAQGAPPQPGYPARQFAPQAAPAPQPQVAGPQGAYGAGGTWYPPGTRVPAAQPAPVPARGLPPGAAPPFYPQSYMQPQQPAYAAQAVPAVGPPAGGAQAPLARQGSGLRYEAQEFKPTANAQLLVQQEQARVRGPMPMPHPAGAPAYQQPQLAQQPPMDYALSNAHRPQYPGAPGLPPQPAPGQFGAAAAPAPAPAPAAEAPAKRSYIPSNVQGAKPKRQAAPEQPERAYVPEQQQPPPRQQQQQQQQQPPPRERRVEREREGEREWDREWDREQRRGGGGGGGGGGRAAPAPAPAPAAQPARRFVARQQEQQQQQQQQPPQQDSRTPPPPPASILAVAGRDRSTAAAQSAPAAVEAQQAPARPPPESPREARPEMAIHEGVELVHIWRDKAETAFGGTWQNTGKDKVLLSRVQPGCLAEQTVSAYIGRQCVAITNCQMTREVKDKEDIISAMQGHRGFVLQFRPMATGEAPTVPEGVPTRSLTKAAGAAHSLRKRLASKAGSLGEKTLSDICEIACTGAPENWFEEVRRVLCMAKEENRHIREKELLKMLFKGIGWEECPLALTEEELCVLASATLFAQRRTDAEVTQGLRSALGVTGSDEEYEQRVQEREAKARQQELARQRKKEEERQRLVECQKRLEERLKQIGDATPESPAQLPPPPAAPAQPAAAKPDAERSSPPPAPTAPAGRYKLSDTWAFWHNGRRGLQQLHAGISTLEDFWRVVNNIPAPSTLLPGDSYSFFRHDSAGVPIRPAPDADANGGGGAWRAQLQGGGAKLDTAWQRLLCSAVGGTLPSSSAVCGVAVERGKGERVGDTVALWLSTVDNEVCSSVEDSFRGATGVTDGAAEFAPHQASPAGGSAGEESP